MKCATLFHFNVMSFPGFHHVRDPDAKRRSEQRGKAISWFFQRRAAPFREPAGLQKMTVFIPVTQLRRVVWKEVHKSLNKQIAIKLLTIVVWLCRRRTKQLASRWIIAHTQLSKHTQRIRGRRRGGGERGAPCSSSGKFGRSSRQFFPLLPSRFWWYVPTFKLKTTRERAAVQARGIFRD